jgi:hypothetical protein
MRNGNTVSMLVGVRTTIGLASWISPRIAGKLFGLEMEGNPQAPYLARLFGARDVALAWGLLSSEGEARRRWLLAGMACDVADTAAGIAGGRSGYLPKLTSALVTSTALSGVVLGAAALGEN